MPDRSFFGGGVQAPVCARDTGIYVGFVISFAILTFMNRGRRPKEFPPLPVWSVLAALVAFMGWDGVTSYAGWRESNNLLRLVTGLCTGFAVAAIVIPLLNDTLWARPGNGRVLGQFRQVVLWLAAIPVSALVMWWGGPVLGFAYPVLIALGILATLTAVNTVLIGTFPRFDRHVYSPRQLVTPAMFGLALSLAEIVASGLIRYWLIG